MKEIFKCELCGNVLELLRDGGSDLVCCNAAMQKLVENSVDASDKKHLPAVEKVEAGVKVKVGEVPHPMKNDHFIEWVEILAANGKTCRKFLPSGREPQVSFSCKEEVVAARSLCNLHGLWQKEINEDS